MRGSAEEEREKALKDTGKGSHTEILKGKKEMEYLEKEKKGRRRRTD